MKKYFIVSDIHAQYKKLIHALKKSGFDSENSNHIFVFGGDALDRGKDGDKIIRFIESLITKKQILGVLGNHDKFLLDMINGDFTRIKFNMMHNGFSETVRLGLSKNRFSALEANFEISAKNILNKYPIFIEWLKNLPPYLEFKNHVLVHGFLDFSLKDWHDTDIMFAIWERGYYTRAPESFTKKIIIGHTPNTSITGRSEIIYVDKKILIDGGAAYGGDINVLVLDEDEI